MRMILALFAAGTLGLVLTSSVLGATDQEAFSKRVGKYATLDTNKPAALCWCKDGFGGPGSGEAGFVVQQVTGGQVLVSCQIPEFNNGAIVEFVQCFVEWDVLAK